MEDTRRGGSYGGPDFDGNPIASFENDLPDMPDGEDGGIIEGIIELLGNILSAFFR